MSKKSYRVFTKYLDQWSARVVLFVGPWDSFVKYLKQKWHCCFDQKQDVNCAGMALRMLTKKGFRKGYCIYMPQMQFTIQDYVTLSHQCIHLASDILQDRGVVTEDPDKQALTYTHDAIYRLFLKKLHGK